MKIARAISVSIWIASVASVFFPAKWGLLSDLHSWVVVAFFGLPTFIVWNAERLAGKVTFLASHGPAGEPPWAVVALGFIMHAVQTTWLWFPRQNWEWLYNG